MAWIRNCQRADPHFEVRKKQQFAVPLVSLGVAKDQKLSHNYKKLPGKMKQTQS